MRIGRNIGREIAPQAFQMRLLGVSFKEHISLASCAALEEKHPSRSLDSVVGVPHIHILDLTDCP